MEGTILSAMFDDQRHCEQTLQQINRTGGAMQQTKSRAHRLIHHSAGLRGRSPYLGHERLKTEVANQHAQQHADHDARARASGGKIRIGTKNGQQQDTADQLQPGFGAEQAAGKGAGQHAILKSDEEKRRSQITDCPEAAGPQRDQQRAGEIEQVSSHGWVKLRCISPR